MKAHLQSLIFPLFFLISQAAWATCPATSASSTDATGHNCFDGTVTMSVSQNSNFESGWLCVLTNELGNGIYSFAGGMGFYWSANDGRIRIEIVPVRRSDAQIAGEHVTGRSFKLRS